MSLIEGGKDVAHLIVHMEVINWEGFKAYEERIPSTSKLFEVWINDVADVLQKLKIYD